MTSEVLSSLAETTSNSATASPATTRKMQVSKLYWVWLLLSIVLGCFSSGIVFAPSNDWKDAAEPHLSVAALRSVENGYSLVRITSSGISAVVDPTGKVLFEKNSYDERLCDFVVDVPLGNGRSFYSWFGDSIAILSGVASCLVVFMAFLPVGKAKPTPACSANAPGL